MPLVALFRTTSFALTLPLSVSVAQWPQRSLVPEQRIGQDAELTGVSRIRLTPKGAVLVAQATSRAILIFDRNGRLMGRAGQKGRGPGDFEMLGEIGSVGDSIWGVDVMSSQVSLFTSGGRVVRAWRVQPPGGSAFNEPIALFSDGTAVIPVFTRRSPTVSEYAVLRSRWDGSKPDTVQHIVTRTTELRLAGAGGPVFSTQPFTEDPLSGCSPDGRLLALVDVAWADVGSDSVRVTVRRIDGQLVYRRTVPLAHERITSAMVDSTVDEKAHNLKARRVSSSAIREKLYVPKYLSPVSGVLVGTDGSVWLKTSRRSSGFAWLIISPRGVPIATVILPRNASVLTLDRGIWGIETDDDGVPTVVRWRVSASGATSRR
jgi:hypothetical protein